MQRRITSTYRLQLTRDFPLASVRELVPYFDKLGVSHLYLSPLLTARAGSRHGYDVIDPTRINPELGTEDDLRRLARELHARQMGIVLDIVPNHMSATAENPYWDDVLERGRASRYAGWFDIDWDAPHCGGKIVLPVLGDDLERVIERGELRLHIRDSGTRVVYFEHSFPLGAATLSGELLLARADPAGRPAADAWAAGGTEGGRAHMRSLLDAQHYRLVHWRRGPIEINYRRFFEVDDLVAVQMDGEEVFEATHKLLLEWVREGVLDGLRVDHVDGLKRPAWYLARLRKELDHARHADSPERFPIFVEKILSGGETLQADWPVEGTTGYDFLNDVEDVFLDPDGVRAIEANYRGLRHNPALEFRAVARESKRDVLADALTADVARVARLACKWDAARRGAGAAGRAPRVGWTNFPARSSRSSRIWTCIART